MVSLRNNLLDENMRKIIFTLLIILTTVSLFMMYKIKGYMYLPYIKIDKTTSTSVVVWSDFYTQLPYSNVNENFIDFDKSKNIFLPLLTDIEQREDPIFSIYASRIRGFFNSKNSTVSLRFNDATSKVQGFVIEDASGGQRKCTYIPLIKEGGVYFLKPHSREEVHSMTALMTTYCNQNINYLNEIKKVTFLDFMYYSVFSCFSFCNYSGYVKVENFRSSFLKKEYLVSQIKKRILETKENINFENELDVTIKGIIGSKKIRYVGYEYNSKFLGRLSEFATYDLNDKPYRLISLNKQSNLTHALKVPIDQMLKSEEKL